MAFHERLSPQDFIDLQQACRDLWVRWLSPEGFFANFHRHFARVCAPPNAAPSLHEPLWIAQNMSAPPPLGPLVARSSSTRCHVTPSDTPISRSDISVPSPAIISKPMTLNRPLSEGDFCRTIEKIVQPGWTCADIGANVGLITEILAECVGPLGKVLAFEAHPTNARVLRKNMRSKGYESRVKVGNVAITDGTQPKVWLYAGRNASDCEWNIVGHDVDGNPTTPELKVTAAKLDTFFPEGSPLNLVKIDIEGAAGPALAGMSRLLRRTRPTILIEFHDEAEWEARTHLLNSDYDLWDLDGRRLDPKKDTRRLYHCLAIPSERSQN